MTEEILNRYNIISGQEANSVDLSKLSSAQRARFLSWLHENNYSISEFNIKENTENVLNGNASCIESTNPFSVHSIGIDVQFISELFPNQPKDLKSDIEFLRIFSPFELAFAETKPFPLHTLAGIFAAKEAIIKARGASVDTDSLAKIEITHGQDGMPNFDGFSLSISHSNDYAVAVALKSEAPTAMDKVHGGNETFNDDIVAKPMKNTLPGFSKITTLSLITVISLFVSNSRVLAEWIIQLIP